MVNYKSMKKFFLTLSILLCSILFCGCSTAEMLVKENANGSIDIYYAIDLNIDGLLQDETITESDVTTMKATLETKASELIAKSKSEYRFNIAKSFSKGKLTESERSTLYNQLTVYTGWNNNVFAVRFKFDTELAYNVYANFGEDVEVFTSSEKQFFTTKISEKFVNPFGRSRSIFNGKSAFNYFNDEINAYLSSNFDEQTIAKFPKFEMIYSYLTVSARLHSDADQIVKTSEGTMHSWKITEENSNKLIEFYTLSANRMVWYLFALTITFVFVAIYLVVIYFKK